MRWKAQPNIGDTIDWHRWFAWHPVRIGRTVFWLEWVERTRTCERMGFYGESGWIDNYRLEKET